MTDREAELLRELEQTRQERDEAREQLADPQRMLDTLRIYGEPFRDLQDIQRVLAEWRRHGGQPSLLESAVRLRDAERERDEAQAHARELREGIQTIASLPGRMHPVAGYMFDDDPRKIAATLLEGNET